MGRRMQVLERPPIPVVVQQHAEESALLRHVRSVLVRAPHVRLRHLRRLDDRIAAHLDGLAVAGKYGTALCTAALERAGTGEVFALAVRLVDERDERGLDRLVALAAALPEASRGLLSAFGWLSAGQLRGVVQSLLASADAHRRALGLGACRLHRADPGPVLMQSLAPAAPPGLRTAALRAACELGRTELLPQALALLRDPDPQVAGAAAACACLLGNRREALDALQELAATQEAARALLLLAGDLDQGRDVVRRLAKAGGDDAKRKRAVIAACGLLGDLQFVPWLVSCMEDDVLARIAGESFSLLTGADLAALDLERKPPEHVPGGPTEDPDDDDVALDPDESLPWPDRARIEKWWHAHAASMQAHARCFMGGPPTREHCAEVLRDAFQRQRAVAAHHLCLLAPGTTLFPLAAPAWRQQRLLAG